MNRFHFLFPLSECGGTYYTNNGSIDYPHGEGTNYAHDMSCHYVIHVDTGKAVNITFTQFNLEESGSSCPYDWVQVRREIIFSRQFRFVTVQF